MARMPGAEWRGPLPATNYRAGAMAPVVGVVVHHMAGSWQAAEGRFTTPGAGASAHFGVRYDGSIIQWVDTGDVAYHACGANWHGWIGIENESSPDAPDAPLTAAQVDAVRRIVGWLGTPLRPATSPTSGGVGYHRQFPGRCTNDDWGSTDCPGDGIVAQIPAICTVEEEEDDDVANAYIRNPDATTEIWEFDGIWRRHVLPDEWKLANDLAALAGKTLGVLPVSKEMWDSIPVAGSGSSGATTVTSTVTSKLS